MENKLGLENKVSLGNKVWYTVEPRYDSIKRSRWSWRARRA